MPITQRSRLQPITATCCWHLCSRKTKPKLMRCVRSIMETRLSTTLTRPVETISITSTSFSGTSIQLMTISRLPSLNPAMTTIMPSWLSAVTRICPLDSRQRRRLWHAARTTTTPKPSSLMEAERICKTESTHSITLIPLPTRVLTIRASKTARMPLKQPLELSRPQLLPPTPTQRLSPAMTTRISWVKMPLHGRFLREITVTREQSHQMVLP